VKTPQQAINGCGEYIQQDLLFFLSKDWPGLQQLFGLFTKK
jgi:hypothetical protein